MKKAWKGRGWGEKVEGENGNIWKHLETFGNTKKCVFFSLVGVVIYV